VSAKQHAKTGSAGSAQHPQRMRGLPGPSCPLLGREISPQRRLWRQRNACNRRLHSTLGANWLRQGLGGAAAHHLSYLAWLTAPSTHPQGPQPTNSATCRAHASPLSSWCWRRCCAASRRCRSWPTAPRTGRPPQRRARVRITAVLLGPAGAAACMSGFAAAWQRSHSTRASPLRHNVGIVQKVKDFVEEPQLSESMKGKEFSEHEDDLLAALQW
jgi:hypothetical protein